MSNMFLVSRGKILISLKQKDEIWNPSLQGGVETGIHFMGSSAAFVLSLYSLMIPFLTSPAPAKLPLPLPPSSSSPCNAGVLLSFVWLLILAKRTDQIFLLQCMRLSAGASQIWWLGLTDGRGPRVLKFVTDSGGFDSPRSSHTGSPKTPGEKRGGEGEGG